MRKKYDIDVKNSKFKKYDPSSSTVGATNLGVKRCPHKAI